MVVPLRRSFSGPPRRNQAGESISRASAAPSVTTALAGPREGELGGDHGRKMPEEVWDGEQRAAGNAGCDFRHAVSLMRLALRKSTFS